MALTLISNNFKDGETLEMDHVLSADCGFGCGAAAIRSCAGGADLLIGAQAALSPARYECVV